METKLSKFDPVLQLQATRDAFWGQSKGGRLASHFLSSDRAITMREARSMKYGEKVSTKTTSRRPRRPLQWRSVLVEHQAELAEFVGRILGDGSPLVAPTYCASEIESQQRMQILVSKLFGYTPEIKVSNGTYRIQMKRICGHILKLLDVPFGRKSVTNPTIPRFITANNDPSIWISFLAGIFDDEACVSDHGVELGLAVRQSNPDKLANEERPIVRSNTLDGISELLTRLGLPHSSRKGQTYPVQGNEAVCWFIRIPPREAHKVSSLGLFRLPSKLQKLNSLAG